MDRKSDDEWDFYPCLVDDVPASIFLNLAYRHRRPEGRDTLYYVGLQILDPGERGMGTEADAKHLWDLEDTIVKAADREGFTYVGRLRNHGDWQLTFYAARAKEQALEKVVARVLSGKKRGSRMGSKADARWSYYDDFLFPPAERFQWMMDRRVVQQLMEAGDHHETPRTVDHFIHFPSAASRSAFVAAVRAKGFEANETPPEKDRELPYPVALRRADAVVLDHIHGVVMELIELSAKHGGAYDGWGAPIARTSAR